MKRWGPIAGVVAVVAIGGGVLIATNDDELRFVRHHAPTSTVIDDTTAASDSTAEHRAGQRRHVPAELLASRRAGDRRHDRLGRSLRHDDGAHRGSRLLPARVLRAVRRRQRWRDRARRDRRRDHRRLLRGPGERPDHRLHHRRDRGRRHESGSVRDHGRNRALLRGVLRVVRAHDQPRHLRGHRRAQPTKSPHAPMRPPSPSSSTRSLCWAGPT